MIVAIASKKTFYLPDSNASASPACFTRAMRVVSPLFCRTSTRFPPNTLCTRTVTAKKASILLGTCTVSHSLKHFDIYSILDLCNERFHLSEKCDSEYLIK